MLCPPCRATAVHLDPEPRGRAHPDPPRTIGSRWPTLNAGTQALLTLAYLRKGERFADLAAGLRWPVEECFEAAKDDFGLDQSQVRTYTALRRHTVLVCAALAICSVTAARLRTRTDRRARAARATDEAPPQDPGQVPLTVPEIRRLWAASHAPRHSEAHRWLWSWWTRRHQARSQWYHQRRNLNIWEEFQEVTT